MKSPELVPTPRSEPRGLSPRDAGRRVKPGGSLVRRDRFGGWRLVAMLVALAAWVTSPAAAGEPVALHIGSLVVAPPHTPPVFVTLANLQSAPYQGAVAIKVPPGWTFKPPQIDVSLAPGETKRVAFTITRGMLDAQNRYPIEATATGADATVSRRQDVVCASAPYFKPAIDGDPADWKDAIPVTFTTGGKKTAVSTFWNRRSFSILVAVEEDKLVGDRGSGPADAVQVAISSQGSATAASPDAEAARYEFLLAADSSGRQGKCYLLAEPATKLAHCQTERPVGPLAYDDAELSVSRREGTTYYECSIPFKLMRDEIPPGEGREFCLSILVHDPDGTGLRDWGQAAGLWESQRNRLAWSLWKGAKWGDKSPFDNKTPWGLCSSKY